ncbi:Uncharacterised protein [uncultured archaeon]|nr:Uncharacterised protein [uncultured archaeon]
MLGIAITLVAVAYVLTSAFLQRKLVNPRRVYEVQETIKKKTNELNEMSKSKASPEAMLAKQKEVTALLSSSMKSQMKPMFVVFPIFLVLYYLVLPAAFPATLKVTVPILSMQLDYKSYFIMIAFVLGFAISMALMVYDRSKAKKAAPAVPAAGANAKA